MENTAGNYLTKIGWGNYQRKALLCALESEALIIGILMLLPTIDINFKALLNTEKSISACIMSLSAILTSSYFVRNLQKISHIDIYKNFGYLLLFGLIILLFASSILEIYISMIVIGIGLGGDFTFNFHILCDSSPIIGRSHYKWISVGIDFINIFIYSGVFVLAYYKIDIFPYWKVIVFFLIIIHCIFMYLRSSLVDGPLLLYRQGKNEELKNALKTIAVENEIKDFNVDLNEFENHSAPIQCSLGDFFMPPLSSATFKLSIVTVLTFSSFIGFGLFIPELILAPSHSQKIGILAVMRFYSLMGKFLSSMGIGSEFNRKVSFLISSFAVGACVLNFSNSTEFYHYIRYSVIYGASSSISTVALYSLIQDNYLPEYWGLAFMLKNCMESIGSIFGTILFGTVFSSVGSASALIWIGSASILAGLIGLSFEIKSSNENKSN
ncbi:unnamed protein product [Blepharisma stoltei]|uniref:MFS transporter n=1 Tax=Blepharisma stoltei TaxID=1481888 RepID=A0AAU9KG45_9CILI|nr:unnamed protein product [Blepharisma stoltei]